MKGNWSMAVKQCTRQRVQDVFSVDQRWSRAGENMWSLMTPIPLQTRRTVQNTELAVHGKSCLDLNLGSLWDLWAYGNESSL